VLLLKNGRVLAAGKKSAVLNSATLSEVFDSRMKLTRRNGRYAMSVSAKPSVMV
jgi:ABC-type cobalamin transport system ATPase subunit